MILEFGFSRAKSNAKIFSSLIRLFTWAPYSHAFVKFHDQNGEWVFQASATQVNIVPWNTFLKSHMVTDIYEIDTRWNESRLWVLIRSYLGRHYDVKSILGFLLVLPMKFIGVKITNPFGDGEKTLFCNELCYYVLKHTKGVTFDLDPESMTPRDYKELLDGYLSTVND